MVSMKNTEKLVKSFVTSKLDYCNTLLGGCPARLINKTNVFLLELRSMTISARFCQDCIGSL